MGIFYFLAQDVALQTIAEESGFKIPGKLLPAEQATMPQILLYSARVEMVLDNAMEF